ncbi:replication initiation protein [Duganella vulcania]|uniref:RepB family plasmid replication initiator protein n=1 Tax=Duganella vulcania TaxID=2692166 RepID=A0A845GJ40_9BURK|nr:replication initiation protein [Duganella vulcania]MYM92757.1 RepB family plasmid replication initiator protein [Duganella vulcania]
MDDGQQLALLLFENLAPQGKSVTEAPTSLGFQRSNAFVRIVDLSLAARRLLDVAYFIVATDPEIQKIYRVDAGLFKWLLSTTTENRAHLKKLIREAQRGAIEINGPDIIDADTGEDHSKDWGSVPLMGPAFLAGGEFVFELAERLQIAIKNPKHSHFLSMRYVFKSIFSKILYDQLQPFIEEGITPWFDLETLRVWLQCEKKTYNVFKYFRSKALDVAIDEINEVAKLGLELITQNVPGSKKIGQVRFKWDTSKKATEQNVEFIVLRKTYETLKSEFALNGSEIEEIIKNRDIFTDERINSAMEYTRHQVKAGKVKLRAGGYFMKALREDFRLGSLDKEIHERNAAAIAQGKQGTANKTAREQKSDQETTAKQLKQAALGWDAFELLEDDNKAAIVREYCSQQTSEFLARRLDIEPSELPNHLTNPIVHTSFGSFVALKVQKANKAAKGDSSMNLFEKKIPKA